MKNKFQNWGMFPAMLALCAGCGTSQSSNQNVSGDYVGTVNGGAEILKLTLTQSGSTFSGSMTETDLGGFTTAPFPISGTISGNTLSIAQPMQGNPCTNAKNGATANYPDYTLGGFFALNKGALSGMLITPSITAVPDNIPGCGPGGGGVMTIDNLVKN